MVLLSKVYSKAVTSLKSKTSLVKVFYYSSDCCVISQQKPLPQLAYRSHKAKERSGCVLTVKLIESRFCGSVISEKLASYCDKYSHSLPDWELRQSVL